MTTVVIYDFEGYRARASGATSESGRERASRKQQAKNQQSDCWHARYCEASVWYAGRLSNFRASVDMAELYRRENCGVAFAVTIRVSVKTFQIPVRLWTPPVHSIIIRTMDHFSLAAGFPQSSEAEWLALVDKALAKSPFESLRTRLHEGFTTEPLYKGPQSRPPLFGARGWTVVQPLTALEAQAADDLAQGAGALSIGFDAEFGVETAGNLRKLLAADVPCILAPGATLADAALVLAARDKSTIAGSAGFDPLAAFAVSGERPAQKAALFADYVDATFHMSERFPSFVPFLASGHAWDGAGGSATEELAFTLGAGVSYWRALAEAGMPLAAAAGCIGFSLTASADIFLTIAKFRALRLLWARALEAAGEKPQANLLLLARMPERILTAYDPHVNLLRGTAAAFGAAIGGATGIEVLPFDSASGSPAAFSRRLARNTSLILQEESYLSAVADAAAGSAYLEALTDGLAASAWALFREVEAKGGLAAAIESGFVEDRLRRKAGERERAMASRADKITGVSVFPNSAEKAPCPISSHSPDSEGRHPFAGKLPALARRGQRRALCRADRGSPRGRRPSRVAHGFPPGRQHRRAGARHLDARRRAFRKPPLARGFRP